MQQISNIHTHNSRLHPEYFEINNLKIDRPIFLEAKRQLFDILTNPQPTDVKQFIVKILNNTELNPREKIRLLATSPLHPRYLGYTVFHFLLRDRDEEDNAQKSNILIKCLDFLAANAATFSQDIYNLLLARENYFGPNFCLATELFFCERYLPHFITVLKSLRISKPQLITLLSMDIIGHTSAQIAAGFLKLGKPYAPHAIYLKFLTELKTSKILTAEDVLELLSYPDYRRITADGFIRAADDSIKYLIDMVGDLNHETPSELVMAYFGAGLMFAYRNPTVSRLLILASGLNNDRKKHLLTLHHQIQSLAIATPPLELKALQPLDSMLLKMQQALERQQKLQKDQEQKLNNQSYMLLRQSIYEKLVAMVIDNYFAKHTTANTIPYLINLLVTICQEMPNDLASRYLFQLLNFIENADLLNLPMQLGLNQTNDNSPMNNTFYPEREEQLIFGLKRLYDAKLLSTQHLFLLFLGKPPYVLFSFTTSAAAQELLNTVCQTLVQEGFGANYFFKIYQCKNGYNENTLQTRIKRIAYQFKNQASAPLSVELVHFWLKQGVSPEDIFGIFIENDYLAIKDQTRASQEHSENPGQIRDISVVFALTNNAKNFATLINSLRLLIQHGLPENLIINYFVLNHMEKLSKNADLLFSLLDKIIWNLAFGLHNQGSNRYLKEESIALLFDFLSELNPSTLRNKNFFRHFNTDLRYCQTTHHMDVDLFRSALGTIVWQACAKGFYQIGTDHHQLFLEFLERQFNKNSPELINALIGCLNPSTPLGAYFRNNPSMDEAIIARLRNPLRTQRAPSTLELGMPLALQMEETKSEANAAEFLVNFLQARKVPHNTILQVLNRNVHIVRPILHYQSSRPQNSTQVTETISAASFSASTSSVTSAATTAISTQPTLSLIGYSLNCYLESHIFPAYLAESDDNLLYFLQVATGYVNLACDSGQKNHNQLQNVVSLFSYFKTNNFFEHVFHSFYRGNLAPETMDQFFKFIATTASQLSKINRLPDNALNGFLNPYLKTDTVEEMEITGYLIWLKAKYNIAPNSEEGVGDLKHKSALLLFICNNFRNIKTQATILMACLDFNSSLGRMLRRSRHPLLARAPLIGDWFQTSIDKGSALVVFQRLKYLAYLSYFGFTDAAVFSISSTQPLIPKYTLYPYSSTQTGESKSVTQMHLTSFNPTLDVPSLSKLMRDGLYEENGWLTVEQRQSILAYSRSKIPLEANLITQEEIAQFKSTRGGEIPPTYVACCQLSTEANATHASRASATAVITTPPQSSSSVTAILASSLTTLLASTISAVTAAAATTMAQTDEPISNPAATSASASSAMGSASLFATSSLAATSIMAPVIPVPLPNPNTSTQPELSAAPQNTSSTSNFSSNPSPSLIPIVPSDFHYEHIMVL